MKQREKQPYFVKSDHAELGRLIRETQRLQPLEEKEGSPAGNIEELRQASRGLYPQGRESQG